MQLVSGREFRFPTGIGNIFAPMSGSGEYGSIVKQVVELSVISLASGTVSSLFTPFSYGPSAPTLTTNTPIIKFHHLSASIYPQASTPKPVGSNIDVRMTVVWTAGISPTDNLWQVTNPINVNALNPNGNGIHPTRGGLAAYIEPSHPGFIGAGFYGESFIFPPIDYSSGIRRAGGVGEWDGSSFLNTYFSCATVGAPGSISAGTWRLVHIFSEMTM